MNAETIACLNYVVHSLVIGSAAWLLVRFVIRDALRRCILANLAVLMCLYTPFNVGMQDLMPKPKEEAPVWTPIRETLKADWRVSVAPVSAPEVKVVSQERRWDVNDGMRGLRWFSWSVTALLLLRLLVQSVRVQRWAWGLREPTPAEMDLLPQDARLGRLRVFETEGTPCVAGWFFPVIAVPAGAFQKLTPWQWGWVLRHEAEHLRLHDTVAVILQNIVRACLWWNPFVHALVEDYAQAREEMCDDAAVGEQREHTAYADFLLECAARPGPQQACVMPIAYSQPARRLKARLVALMEARGVRKKVGALFVLALVAFAVLAPVVAASFGVATAEAQEPVKTKVDRGPMYTRAYKVAPDFLSMGEPQSDPFAGGTGATTAVIRKSARELLEDRGIPFPGGASAIYNPATSQLIVRHYRQALDQIEAIVDRLSKRTPLVHFQCKLIQADGYFETHGGILKPDEAKELWRQVSQKKGIELATMPSTTGKLGAEAIAEAVQEVFPEKITDANINHALKLIGPSIKLTASLAVNGKALVVAKVDLGVDLDGAYPWLPQKGDKPDWNRVETYTSSAKAELASGETLVMHLRTSKKYVTVLMTAEALNPTGQKAINFESTATVLPSSTGIDLPDKAANEWSQRVYRVPQGFPNDKPPMEVLQTAGISFEKNASAVLRDGKLTVRNTKPNLELIEVWLGQLHEAAVNKRVVVNVKAVEMKGNLLELMKEWVPPLPDAPKPAVVTDPTLLLPAASPPAGEILRQSTIAGILSDSQFQTVMKKLAVTHMKLEILRLDDISKKYKLPDTMGGLEATVESKIGGDGNTIELIITVESVNRSISTGVSIWDGQTVIMGAQPSDHLTRCLFITAHMVSDLPAQVVKEEEKK
ncbi:M56 family metallopeptidase [Prosthecobacter sp.]|uniref:M56 family metallopeptidase n=1 Tax=Prosthecobacter sp. TaxID=1965333 RepID=UPI003784F909